MHCEHKHAMVLLSTPCDIWGDFVSCSRARSLFDDRSRLCSSGTCQVGKHCKLPSQYHNNNHTEQEAIPAVCPGYLKAQVSAQEPPATTATHSSLLFRVAREPIALPSAHSLFVQRITALWKGSLAEREDLDADSQTHVLLYRRSTARRFHRCQTQWWVRLDDVIF